MKKIIFILSLWIGLQTQAQLSISAQANGIVGVSYGTFNDFSLYDPQGDTQIYLYLWINTDQTTPNLSAVYNDDWNDSSSLIVLNYDSSLMEYSGQIDFNAHNFPGEGILPSVNLQDFNMILRNQAGDRQSTDLLATTYGFPGIADIAEINDKEISYYSKGILTIDYDNAHQFDISVYDISGKAILQHRQTSNIVNLKEVKSKFFIVRVVIDEQKFFVKKILQ